jgi:glutamine amidotransferase-like uncharacterized protein
VNRRGEIVIYAGQGSSHSWTWLADLFEEKGVYSVRFLDVHEFVPHLSAAPSTVIVSGGDGFRIAEGLAGKGFRALREFIQAGGLYVGICAGAYLPLPSSIGPLSEFNVSNTKIENLDKRAHDLAGVPTRVAVPYGSCSIVHLVRGELRVECEGKELLAPLYGGPVFKEPVDGQVLATYRGFTENTEFQMSRRLAEQLIPGRPAATRSSFGKGTLLLLGPHFEHPGYSEANSLFLRILGLDDRLVQPRGGLEDHPSLDRAVADLKVAIVGLENRSFVVGKKLWDGGRYMELVRTIESRTWTMGDDLSEDIATSLWRVRESLISMKVGIETDADSTTELLVESTRACVDNHFQALARGR